jgi:hypothetical protein
MCYFCGFTNERKQHIDTCMQSVGRREKRKDWLSGIHTHDTGKRREVIMTSVVRDMGLAGSKLW